MKWVMHMIDHFEIKSVSTETFLGIYIAANSQLFNFLSCMWTTNIYFAWVLNIASRWPLPFTKSAATMLPTLSWWLTSADAERRLDDWFGCLIKNLPDISYAVSMGTRHHEGPRNFYWHLMTKTIRNLKGNYYIRMCVTKKPLLSVIRILA